MTPENQALGSIKKGKRAALYFRVSTDDQSSECQRPEVMRIVEARGYSVVAEFDEVGSAAKVRPKFDAMVKEALLGRFDVIVIWALDRFGRSMSGNLRDVLELDKAGIKVVSVREPWMDTAGPVRELLIAIFGWVAQHERSRLIERTRAGLERARRAGAKLGRPCYSLLPVAERNEIVGRWIKENRPNGFRGLAVGLGGCSAMTARTIFLKWKSAQNTDVSDESVGDELNVTEL